MATYFPPKNGSAFIMYVGLESVATAGTFQGSATLASGDFKVSIDGGTLNNLTTLPTVTPGSSKMVKISLSGAEMTGDNITVVCSDAAGSEWKDLIINLQTVARQIDDLTYPTTSGRSLDVTATGEAGIDWGNIGSPTTTVLLSGTTVATVTTTATATAVTTVNGLASGVITATSIAADAITAAKVADGTIDAATFAAGAINAAAIAADAITDAKVAADVTIASVTGSVGSVTAAVTVGTINAGVITATSIATDAITAAKIAADAIGASELAADAVAEIQNGLATPTNITAGTIANVTTVNGLAAGVITAASIAADAITAAKIATNAIDADALATDAVSEIVAAMTAPDNTTISNIYSRIGAPVGASISADIAGVQADTDDIQTRLGVNGVGLTALASATNLATANTNISAINTKLGTPAGASVSADIAAIKTDTAAIKAKSDGLPSDPADASDIAAAVAALQADTDNIQTRLPAALVGGRIDASIGSLATGSLDVATFTDALLEKISDVVNGRGGSHLDGIGEKYSTYHLRQAILNGIMQSGAWTPYTTTDVAIPGLVVPIDTDPDAVPVYGTH